MIDFSRRAFMRQLIVGAAALALAPEDLIPKPKKLWPGVDFPQTFTMEFTFVWDAKALEHGDVPSGVWTYGDNRIEIARRELALAT